MERAALLIILSLALILAGCADTPEVTVGQDTITIGVTEQAPVRVRVASQPGESFENLEASMGESDLIQVLATNYSKRSLEDDDISQISFTALGLQAGEQRVPITINYDDDSIETAVTIHVTEPGLALDFADKKSSVVIGDQEEFSLTLHNPDDETYGWVRVEVTSDWPDWVALESLPGWPTNSTGERLVLPVQVPAGEERRIPFYVTATPQANAATFTLLYSLEYSSNGEDWATLHEGARTVQAS